MSKTVFISYQREMASFIARAVFQDLMANGYDVLIGNDLSTVATQSYFLPILTNGTLELRHKSEIWQQIELAIHLEKIIIPLLVNDFQFKPALWLGTLEKLKKYPSIRLQPQHFEEMMHALRTQFLGQTGPNIRINFPEAELQAEVFFLQAYHSSKTGDFKGTIQAATHALSIFPNYGAAYQIRGQAAYDLGDYEAAHADFSHAIRSDYADLHLAYDYRGLIHGDWQDYVAALYDHSEAIRLKPDFALAYYHRGMIYQQQGNLLDAQADFKKEIRLNGGRPISYYQLGLIYIRLGDLKAGIREFNRAIILKPNFIEALFDRAEAYFEIGLFERAFEDFENLSSQSEGDYIRKRAGLAITYYALGHHLAAFRTWFDDRILSDYFRTNHADKLGQELNWSPSLIEASRQLIDGYLEYLQQGNKPVSDLRNPLLEQLKPNPRIKR